MIKLTRLGGEAFVLNAELIRYVEARPDTFITLTTGERVVVVESMDDVITRAISYQQQKHWLPMPSPSLTSLGTAPPIEVAATASTNRYESQDLR